MNPLSKLPVMKIYAKAWRDTSKLLPVLIDGDYDGEFLSGINWRVDVQGYVVLARPYQRKLFGKQYLHHFVLPPKPGFWVTHLNGDRLDNRSVNIGYKTPRQLARERVDRLWEIHQRKFYDKLNHIDRRK